MSRFVDARGTLLPTSSQSTLRQVGVDPEPFADGQAPVWDDDAGKFVPASLVPDDLPLLVVLSDFGTGPEPVTDADGLWLYGRFDIELEY